MAALSTRLDMALHFMLYLCEHYIDEWAMNERHWGNPRRRLTFMVPPNDLGIATRDGRGGGGCIVMQTNANVRVGRRENVNSLCA